MTAAARFGPIGLFVLVLIPAAIPSASAVRAQTAGDVWQPLFDGKSLTNWQSTKFGGDGDVKVENGQIILEAGKTLTGITWSGGELPKTNYEIAMQGMRVAGHDFFAGITFPVGESFCSLILGGWGGSVVGLSSINFLDASENETSQSMEFENGRWYTVRIRVTPEKIQAWLDDRQIIDQALKDNKISVRIEVEPSKPLGIATWKTTGALRDIKLRRL
jgi:3-keto-disaccharide hydrolase